ncbi:MAG: N-acyl homoserine lactonase family protein [Actinobacteria bacterium]|nr:N-acyl homoserine lactonase family protein [Actinomycetota bacterium]
MGLRIHHLVTGELESPLSVSLFNSGKHPHLKHQDVLPYSYRYDLQRRDGTIVEGVMVPVPVWYIAGAEKRILVDTGFGSCEELIRVGEPHGHDYICRKNPEWDIKRQLATLGLEPSDIDIVVHTHLHFDHFMNNELFENATFIVQRDEIPMVVAPPPFGIFYYEELASHLINVLGRVMAIDGNMKVCEGVELFKVGGHSPGWQVVMVKTDKGKVALVGDLMYNYKNLELNWPPGAFWRMDQMMEAYNWVRTKADIIVPNHDWKFRKLFPEGIIG